MMKSNFQTAAKYSALRAASLSFVCVIALAAATATPVTLDGNGPAFKIAVAGNGNGGGNGGSNGRDSAPGQEKKLAAEESASDENAISSVAGESGETEEPTVLPIADDAEPASNKVIKELAGLPEESALSEEEELEAIRSGWGTWRTADGPETVIAQ